MLLFGSILFLLHVGYHSGRLLGGEVLIIVRVRRHRGEVMLRDGSRADLIELLVVLGHALVQTVTVLLHTMVVIGAVILNFLVSCCWTHRFLINLLIVVVHHGR